MHKLPVKDMRIHSVEFMFRDYLKAEFGDVSKANAALGTSAGNWIDFFPPQMDFQYLDFHKRALSLKWEYCARNFYTVLDFLFFHGKALFNTVVYCMLAIAVALIVNPIAAYALSRYRPPSTYKILLFLMLTMAFPPMVTQIPVFLMMRSFNLLNTFAALILPVLANGYAIFLLKGFFDSLPKELYESASIDGAGEFQMFWQITMRLSTPILAVIALSAFTSAYGNFMFALLICQDQDMWTIMPWLYQMQIQSCQGVVFSALVIAAIPTFIIFSLCQNVIMRGIVVPSEK
jgi:multiple sugar transport system permease protein